MYKTSNICVKIFVIYYSGFYIRTYIKARLNKNEQEETYRTLFLDKQIIYGSYFYNNFF